ncbi:MAG: nuoG, partial [Solirubrobacterales bacterium]|nr:nuoG [Solirubrobacterales bacterium]
AELLRTGGGDAPGDVVVLWGTSMLQGDGGAIAPALLKLASGLNLSGRQGGGLLAVPASTNERGLLEAGVAPGIAPGYGETAGSQALAAAGIAAALRAGDLTALYLLHDDPLRSRPDANGWDHALEKTTAVIAHSQFLTAGLEQHANVVFPAESYAEKEGTLTHPDGRVQRLRPAIGRQGGARPEWWVLSELAKRLGADLGILTGAMASKQLFDAVPFYRGLSLDRIGGKGLRWPADATLAAAFPAAPEARRDAAYETAATPNGALRLGVFRSVWAGPEVELSPALKFLAPRQTVEMAPSDAQRLGVRHGEKVLVGGDGASVEATVALRDAALPGSVFLQTGITTNAANVLDGPLVEIRKT